MNMLISQVEGNWTAYARGPNGYRVLETGTGLIEKEVDYELSEDENICVIEDNS